MINTNMKMSGYGECDPMERPIAIEPNITSTIQDINEDVIVIAGLIADIYAKLYSPKLQKTEDRIEPQVDCMKTNLMVIKHKTADAKDTLIEILNRL